MARLVNGKYESSVKLEGKINSPVTREGDASVSADEGFIIVTIYGRKDSFGNGDLYISYRTGEEWSDPENLGENINSTSKEYAPSFSADKKKLLFTSYRASDDQSAGFNKYDQIADDFKSI